VREQLLDRVLFRCAPPIESRPVRRPGNDTALLADLEDYAEAVVRHATDRSDSVACGDEFGPRASSFRRGAALGDDRMSSDAATGPTYRTDPRVDAYLDALPGCQQAICQEVRD